MPQIDKTCVCGTDFKVYPYREATALYCSHACLAKYRTKRPAGFKNPKGALAKLGAKNPMFGKLKEDVGYAALHSYVKKYLTKSKACDHCQEDKPLDLANKSGKYLRDLTDWLWLCRKCHLVYDDNLKHLDKGRGWNKGKKMSAEQRAKLREAHLGQEPWNKGKKGLQVAWNKGMRKNETI